MFQNSNFSQISTKTCWDTLYFEFQSLKLSYLFYRGTYPFLATPYLPGAVGDDVAKQAYNNAFKATRSSVERTFGIFKRRFSGLKTGLRFRSMEKCARLIQILGAIHNFVIREHNIDDDLDESEEDVEEVAPELVALHQPLPEVEEGGPVVQEVQTRDTILQLYFR